jgi:hypothetical protein
MCRMMPLQRRPVIGTCAYRSRPKLLTLHDRDSAGASLADGRMPSVRTLGPFLLAVADDGDQRLEQAPRLLSATLDPLRPGSALHSH